MKKSERSIVVVFSLSNSDLMSDCAAYFESIDLRKMLKNETKKMKSALKNPNIPSVSLRKYTLDTVNSEDPKINKEVFEEIRFVVHDIDLRDIVEQECNDDFSHIIEICLCNSEIKAINDNPKFDLSVLVMDFSQVKSLIEDVIFDIQMFYCYSLDKTYVYVDERKNFSRIKKQFCVSKKLSNPYLTNLNSKYCSIASYCRNNKLELDYKKYGNLWKEFEKHLFEMNYEANSNETTGLVEEIIKNHEQGGQLSYNRLYKLIENLDKGRYTLVRISKRPKKKKVIKEFKSLFGGSDVKVGKIRIIRTECKLTYEKYSNLITTYDFEKR